MELALVILFFLRRARQCQLSNSDGMRVMTRTTYDVCVKVIGEGVAAAPYTVVVEGAGVAG
jgi:hypothetical protein